MTNYNVSTAAELDAALSKASGGDTILLAGGNYGSLDISKSYSSELTIRSASSNNPGSFSEMDLEGASNIKFDSVLFDYTHKGEHASYRPFTIDNSSNITIVNSEFSGDMAKSGSDAGYGTGLGFQVTNSSDITVENTEFHSWWKAVNFKETQDIVFSGNEVHSVRSDGMNFVEVQDVLIEKNYVHDFKASPNSDDHKDMLQFWTVNADQPSTDIIIRDNVFDTGDGDRTQTIFMSSDKNLAYENLVIENNTILNYHTNGIYVGHADGLVIRNNTVEEADHDTNNVSGGAGTTPTIRVEEGAVNVTIENNVVETMNGFEGQSSWKVQSNSLSAQPDGSSWQPSEPEEPEVEEPEVEEEEQTQAPDDVEEPEVEEEEQAQAPDEEEEPEVEEEEQAQAPDDNDDETATPPNVGDVDIDDYVLDFSSLANSAFAKGAEYVDGAAQLDGGKEYVDLGRFEDFEESQQLTFAVEFARDDADSGDARLVWNHQKFALSLTEDGLEVQVANNGGEFWESFRIEDLGLNDTDTHKAVVMVDAESDRMQVVLDGNVVFEEADTDFDFVGAGGREWGWTLGNKWGGSLDGEISGFEIDASADFFDTTTYDNDLPLG